MQPPMLADFCVAFQAYLASRGDAALARFLTGVGWAMAERPLSPRRLPVVDALSRVTLPTEEAEKVLLRALASVADTLHWGQTYGTADFGPTFLDNYGWVELFGTRGHFDSDLMAGGVLLLGPDTDYPDHHHEAEEIYIPLSGGSLWSKGGGPYQPRNAGEIIHHPSNVHHAMRTAREPLVALYLWRGGPLAQKSTIVERRDR
jgi:mannose-6-phosphate isomerase-like protein (cupin superfamily)